jgi:hypothetical protein
MAVIMTKDLAEKMAQDYREAIAEAVKFNYDPSYWLFLNAKNIDVGLCHLSFYKYGISLADCDWLNRLLGGRTFLYNPPAHVNTIPEMVECLQYRLNLLEKFITDADAQH